MNEKKKSLSLSPGMKFILMAILILLPFLLYFSLQAGMSIISDVLYGVLIAAFAAIILLN